MLDDPLDPVSELQLQLQKYLVVNSLKKKNVFTCTGMSYQKNTEEISQNYVFYI